MGSLISGIYGLFQGDPTKTEENQLGDLSTFETGQGKAGTTAAGDYYQSILSGDPTRIAETLAPEIKAGQDQAQQKKNTLAQFGTRSGGTAAAASDIDAATRGNIINLVGGLQQGAAGAEASLGTNLLGQASGNIDAEAALARQQQLQEQSNVGDIAKGAGELVSSFF